MPEPVTVVTGSRKGIGRYLAEHYVAAGHSVVGCSRGPSAWDHERYRHHQLDVADEAAVKAMFAAVRREYGRLDHVVNNAGVAAMNHAFLTPGSSVEKTLRTNVLGTFLCCREGAKLMRGGGGGRIVNFVTVAVPLRVAGEAAYVASKAAVGSLTEVLAVEFAPFGVTVNAVGPGPIDTDLIAGVPVEKIDRLIARQAIPERAQVADVANVVDFFLRAESRMITGQTIYLGGV